MNWYYALGDQRQGPISDSELDNLIAEGKVTENTLVWKEGMTNWQPLRDVRPSGAGGQSAPPGWIRCTATGRFFPPEEIVYLDGKPYSAAAKESVLQGVLQTGVLPVSEEGRNGPAWENRAQLGFFPSIIQTIKAVLLDPMAAFAHMKREGGVGAPLAYYVIMSWTAFMLTTFFNYLAHGFAFVMPPSAHNPQMPFDPAKMGAAMIVAMIFLLPVFAIIGAFIVAGIFHLSLMMCQGAQRSFETTLRTFCYAFGSVKIIEFLPWPFIPSQTVAAIGSVIALIWAVVVMCIGVSKTHEIDNGRATLAVLLPVGLCCVCMILMFGAAFAAAFNGQLNH